MLPDYRKDRWLDTATSGIRFYVDRARVRKELEAHMEDKLADLRRVFPGIPEGEAQERMLAGMGDPEEIKKEGPASTALFRAESPPGRGATPSGSRGRPVWTSPK